MRYVYLNKTFRCILIVLFFTIIIPAFYHANAEVCVDGFIKGTNCPCLENRPGIASVCGFVSSADFETRTSRFGEVIYDVGMPLGGATVSIYENTPYVASGQRYGLLERKFSECETTSNEGKFWCPMRRITPGNYAFIIFSCSGKIADIKIIPSARSLTNLNAQVDCVGDFTYTPLPPNGGDSELDYANRQGVMGCTASYPDEQNPNVGFGDGTSGTDLEVTNASAWTGETSFDSKFSKNDGVTLTLGPFSGTVGSHDGSWWENDCIFQNTFNETGGLAVNTERGYELPFDNADYSSVLHKCNYDINDDNDGIMEPQEEYTVPFRHDIPTFTEEHEQLRVWENRTSFQRQMENPLNPARYNHTIFSECMGNYFVRNYGSEEVEEIIPCEVLASCASGWGGDPIRNLHTTTSFGARLGRNVDWYDSILSQEREPTDIVCESANPDIGIVTVAEVQPPFPLPGSTCTIGDAGCGDPPYKLPSTYYFLQFTKVAGGAKMGRVSDPSNDTWAQDVGRDKKWEKVRTEAIIPHTEGSYQVYEDQSRLKTNSVKTSIALSTNLFSNNEGIVANRFVRYIDAMEEEYNYNPSTYIYDIGPDPKALCAMSNVTPVEDRMPMDAVSEARVVISNKFSGNTEDHTTSESAGTSTYATEWGRLRDDYLSQDRGMTAIVARDIYDSLLRFSTGGTVQEGVDITPGLLSDVIGRILGYIDGSAGTNKSFLDRVGAGSPDPGWGAPTMDPYMTINYCIAEDTFRTPDNFPAYGEDGFGEYTGNCYPWRDLTVGQSCNSYPGTPNQWVDLHNQGWSADLVASEEWQGPWPGLAGNLRTCKETQCSVFWKVRWCINREEDPYGNEYCTDTNGDGIFDDHDTYVSVNRRDCTTAADFADPNNEVYECLRDQQDTWRDYSDGNGLDDPPSIGPPDWEDTTGPEKHACDLWRAGPMEPPADLGKDHYARIFQRTPDQSDQMDIGPECQSTAYSALSFRRSVDYRPEACAVSIVDYATTNDERSNTPDSSILNDGSLGATHRDTAGYISKAATGIGALGGFLLRETVLHQNLPFVLLEDYPDPHWTCDDWEPDQYCSQMGAGDNGCCEVTPPGELDIDHLVVDPACAVSSACTSGGTLMQEIAAAAGSNNLLGANQVPGAVILAAMAGETAFEGLWDWNNNNVRSWSDPWYARIPNCNDMVTSAFPPFGLFLNRVPEYISQGGYHPSRENPDGIVIVSRCNLLDGMYLVAAAIANGGAASGSCGGWSCQDARDAIEMFEYGGAGGTLPTRVTDVLESCFSPCIQ